MQKYFEIDIERRENLQQPMTVFYLKNISEAAISKNLRRQNKNAQGKLERIKTSTETLSHEMRAPLGSIIMIMETLIKMTYIRAVDVKV